MTDQNELTLPTLLDAMTKAGVPREKLEAVGFTERQAYNPKAMKWSWSACGGFEWADEAPPAALAAASLVAVEWLLSQGVQVVIDGDVYRDQAPDLRVESKNDELGIEENIYPTLPLALLAALEAITEGSK